MVTGYGIRLFNIDEEIDKMMKELTVSMPSVFIPQVIKNEKRNTMKKLAIFIFALLVTVLVVGFIYWLWIVHWNIGVVGIIVVLLLLIGMYLDGVFDKEEAEPTVPYAKAFGLENPATVQVSLLQYGKDQTELELFRRQKAEVEATEAAKLQKKENKEKIKLYSIEHSPVGPKEAKLTTPSSIIILQEILSVIKTGTSNKTPRVGYTQYDWYRSIVITDLLTNGENRETIIQFENEELRGMVYDKLFGEKGSE